MAQKTLGIVHSVHLTIGAVRPFLAQYLPDVSVMHLCDDTLQRDVIRVPGVIPPHVNLKFAQYAKNLEEAGADLILLACSTMNQAVELARPMIGVPLLQIDRPMMELAVCQGRRVGLLATLASTVPSSERLLRAVAAERRKEVEIATVLRGDAFEALKAGDVDRHNAILLEEIDELSARVDSIVMAQLSMSVLAPLARGMRVPVYDSGTTGFARVREMLAGAPR
jgi:aspartate/glutamate racemase